MKKTYFCFCCSNFYWNCICCFYFYCIRIFL